MLYHAIKRLEKKYNFFNCYFLSHEFILKWLDHLGYPAIPDREVKTAVILKNKKSNKRKGIILYNPHLQSDNLILTLGHELGHILLGHLDYADVLFSDKTFFSKSGLEKDAGIIGFLCWLPTPFLRKLEMQERLSIPELAWELNTCDTEWELMYKLCEARIKIYKALKRIEGGEICLES